LKPVASLAFLAFLAFLAAETFAGAAEKSNVRRPSNRDIHMEGRMNERYREFRASAPSPAEARRRLVEYACEHGTAAAIRMSGAGQTTVARLVRQAGAVAPRPNKPGAPRLAPEDEARIIDARLAHPGASAMRLKRDFGIPHGDHQIKRVLREAGLVSKRHIRDPAFWIRWREKRVEVARLELMVAEVMRKHGVEGRIAQVERLRRVVAREKRKLEWWRKEKERQAGTATAFNAENAKSAEDGGPQGDGNIKLRDVLGGLGVLGVE
jgi:hypothetical protein